MSEKTKVIVMKVYIGVIYVLLAATIVYLA